MSAERPALSWAAKLAANSNDLLPVPPPSAASSSQPKSPAISASKPSTAVATAPSVVADMPFSPIEPPIDGKLKYLIIDTGAIIKGHGRNFHTIAENMLTIPEVVNEIRDSKARELFDSLPYEVIIRQPSDKSIRFVADFAEKTGDFASLSLPDLKVIALAHTLEMECNNGVNLKTEPKFGSLQQQAERAARKAAAIASEEAKKVSEMHEKRVDSHHLAAGEVSALASELSSKASISNDLSVPGTCDVEHHEHTELREEELKEFNEVKHGHAAKPFNNDTSNPKRKSRIRSNNFNYSSDPAGNEDDGVGWVNMDNLASKKGTFNDGRKIAPISTAQQQWEKRVKYVSCMTSDFAMQNVLMQIGLNVSGVDGRVITTVKQFVLRCIGCRTIHYDVQNRLFCSSCGGSHLTKVSCHVDAHTNELKLHLKKDYKVDLRGTVYSLPKPGSHGRYDGEILLREDQLLSGVWKQKVVQVKKHVTSAFGEGIVDDVGLHLTKSQKIFVGLGSKNPNAQKGRERRGKSKKNT